MNIHLIALIALTASFAQLFTYLMHKWVGVPRFFARTLTLLGFTLSLVFDFPEQFDDVGLFEFNRITGALLLWILIQVTQEASRLWARGKEDKPLGLKFL